MLGKNLIHNLCERIGLHIELDASNSCTFEAGEILLSMTFLEETNEVALHADLGPLPTEGREALLLSLMQANYRYRETHGATLSVSDDGERLALFKLLPSDALDDRRFMDITERFVKSAEGYARMRGTVGADIPSGVPQVPAFHSMLMV
ncbi:MAG: type III secretion system chaperone [Succinivibrionaceae bacterium]|nr:type III secretion system chaperone [Succinivibrionaceae bacterium]